MLALFGLVVVLLVQATLLADASAWVTRATAPVWLVVVVVYFVWAVRRLTGTRLAVRDLLPGAILTACGLVALMFLSSIAMGRWVDLYASDLPGSA